MKSLRTGFVVFACRAASHTVSNGDLKIHDAIPRLLRGQSQDDASPVGPGAVSLGAKNAPMGRIKQFEIQSRQNREGKTVYPNRRRNRRGSGHEPPRERRPSPLTTRRTPDSASHDAGLARDAWSNDARINAQRSRMADLESCA